MPCYSNRDIYEGADATSFRGSFLKGCQDVISKEMLNDAWNHKFPEQAVACGRELLAAAEASGKSPKPRGSLLSHIGFAKKSEPVPMSERRNIARAAGRWFIFWGERGHAIRAWF